MPVIPAWTLNEEVIAARYNAFIDLSPDFGIYWQEPGVSSGLGVDDVPIPNTGNYEPIYNLYIGPMLGDFLYVSIDTSTSGTLVAPRLELVATDGTTVILRWTGASHGEAVPTKRDVVLDIRDRIDDLGVELNTFVFGDLRGRIIQARVLGNDSTAGLMHGVTLGWGTSPDINLYGDLFQDI